MPSSNPSIATLITYMKTYITVGYYLLIVPYKITTQKKKSEGVLHDQNNDPVSFQFHTNIYQKVLCALGYISFFYHQIFILRHPEIQGMFPTNEGILSYIGIVHRFIGFAYLLCAILVFWRKKSHFMEIFKTIQSLPYGTTPQRSLILINLGFILSYAWHLYGIPLELFNNVNDQYEIEIAFNLTSGLNSLHSKAQMVIGFDNSPGTVTFESLTVRQGIAAMIYLIVFIFSGLLQIGLEMLVLVGIVYIWHTTRLFEQWYQKLDYTDDSKYVIQMQALKEYQILKTLIRTTNKILGPPIVLVIAFLLPFYATFAGLAISSKGSLEGLPLFILFAHYSIYLTEIIMAAEVNRKGNEFVRWISRPEYIEGLSNRQLTSLSIDMNSNQMALKGCGFFSLTYRFLTSVIGVFLTYSILVVQFRARPEDSSRPNNGSRF